MKASDVHNHLRSLDGGWVEWARTTDRFIAGDPETEVTGIAVGWMSYTWALQRALELGCNLFVTHEPTYFSGHDDEEGIFRFPGVRAKRQWIEERGIAILRCHDVWDQLPDIGVPDCWARFLGFEHPLAAGGFYRLFDVSHSRSPALSPRTARSLAAHVAARTAPYGQSAVELVGPADAPISRLALGTGAITHLTQMLDAFNPDIALCSDDGFVYWHSGALAIELGIPVIVVNHAVSELPGIESLAAHLAEAFPAVPVHHIPQRCMYELVGD